MAQSPLQTESGLEIRVLGPLEVTAAGSPLVVDTRKALAILALLAVEARPYARDELAAMLWPESDDESARGALRRTLSVLRAALGDRWLRVDRANVALDRPGLHVDLETVEAAATVAAAPADGDLAQLRAAAELARGPFLAGFSLRDSPDFDDWRATRAVAAERTVAGLLDGLATALAAAGDTAAAVRAANRRVALDPLDEAAQRRLMTLLARAGDRAGAVRQYRACVAVLEAELGVAPLAETTELYEAIRDARTGAEPAIPAPQPEPTTDADADAEPAGRLPMVGRDRELETLLSTHRGARTDGRLAVVTGEAGIGKTRLGDELRERIAAAGGAVLAARAFPAESGIAYGPIVDLLRAGLSRPGAGDRLGALERDTLLEVQRLAPLPAEIARGLGPVSGGSGPSDQPAARVRLLEAIATTLAALASGPVPGLLTVEDAQWVDEASREAVLYLARRLSDRPMLLLLSWRPEDLDALGSAFALALEELPRAAAIALHRLNRDEVARLLAAAIGQGSASYEVDALLDESEGVPLYVVEALAAGPRGPADDQPRGVRALLRERLAAVSETAAQVLAAAAVIGRSFDLATVRGASGRSEDETVTALEELVRRGIVRELEPRPDVAFDFAHGKLRDAAYAATSLARRRLLHRRTAEVLRAGLMVRDDPGNLVLVANHERAAGRDAQAAESFREAGFRARDVFANRAAAAHLEMALALGHPDAAGLQLVLGELRTALGDYAGAIAALEAAASVATEDALPAIELRLGRVHARRGDLPAAASHLDAAIEALEPGGAASDPALLVRALVERAVVAHRARALDLAAATASRALAIAEASGDGTGSGAAYRMLGLLARDRGDLDAARAALLRSLALADADPDAGASIAARNALALVEAAAGNRVLAIELLETALGACRRVGERHLEAAVENNLADQLHAAGRTMEAMVHLKQAVAIFAEVGGRPGELEPEIWKLVAW